MGNARIVFILGLFLLFSVPGAFAIGISPAIKTLEYVPGKTYELEFSAVGAESIETYVRGDLAPYAEIIDPSQGSGPRPFKVILRLPEELDPPGKRTLLVGVIEAPSQGGTITARAAYQAPVIIFVPYPGIYLEASFSAPSANVDEPVNFSIQVNNLGKDAVQRLAARVIVTDAVRETVVADLASQPISLAGSSSTMIRLGWDTRGISPGPFRAKALIEYDGDILEREEGFRIGDQIIRIINFTRQATEGSITPFDIEVQSDWNSRFSGVYGDVNINGNTFRTPSVDVDPLARVKLTGYYDATHVAAGSYPAEVRVRYADTLTVASGMVAVAAHAVEESPASLNLGGRVVLAAILVIAALAFIVLRRRRA